MATQYIELLRPGQQATSLLVVLIPGPLGGAFSVDKEVPGLPRITSLGVLSTAEPRNKKSKQQYALGGPPTL